VNTKEPSKSAAGADINSMRNVTVTPGVKEGFTTCPMPNPGTALARVILRVPPATEAVEAPVSVGRTGNVISNVPIPNPEMDMLVRLPDMV
jgi:hypothetical protein